MRCLWHQQQKQQHQPCDNNKSQWWHRPNESTRERERERGAAANAVFSRCASPVFSLLFDVSSCCVITSRLSGHVLWHGRSVLFLPLITCHLLSLPFSFSLPLSHSLTRTPFAPWCDFCFAYPVSFFPSDPILCIIFLLHLSLIHHRLQFTLILSLFSLSLSLSLPLYLLDFLLLSALNSINCELIDKICLYLSFCVT